MGDDLDTTMRLTSTVYPHASEGESQRNQETLSKRNLYGFNGVPSQYRLTKRISHNNNSMELQTVGVAVEDEAAEKSLSARVILTGFMDFTTSHGITHTYHAKGTLKKLFWGFLTLASTVLLCLHLWIMISGYIAYDSVTNININEARSLDFPAVTVCNNNGVKRSNMPSWMDDLVKSSMGSYLNGSDDKISKNDLVKKISEEISLLNTTEKSMLGYSYADMIILCSFNGENCFESDFWTFYHSVYGNCYSFNTGKNGAIQKTSLAGPSNGLTLIINIGLYEYVKFLTEEAGIKVVIHDQKAMPFPDHDSLSTSPGQVNNIAVKMMNTTRLDGNYGNCTRLDSNEDNMYFYPYNVSYTQWACLRTCYQKELVNTCKCFDPDLPYDYDTIVFNHIEKAKGPCKLTNSTNVNCITEVSSRFADRTLKCGTCYQPCNEILYESTQSTSSYPALSYIDDFVAVINKTNPLLLSKLKDEYGDDQVSFAIQSNFLKINVFHQRMTYTTYEQVASYDDYQFASDFGGAWGLWIGWSTLTIFELIELGLDMLVYYCYNANKSQPSQ